MVGQGDTGWSQTETGGRLRLVATVASEVTHRAAYTEGDLTELVGNPAAREVCLPAIAESAGVARRLTRGILQRHWAHPEEFTDEAELLVSELVGNAVRHAGAQVFGLRLLRRRGWVRIEVRDPSRALPCLLPVDSLDLSGRGLFLVNHYAQRWGVDLHPGGKTTWCEMRAV